MSPANFLGPAPTLAAGNVRLEPLSAPHFPALFAALNDPVLWTYLPTPLPEDANAWQAECTKNDGLYRLPACDCSWVICDATSGEVAGTTSFLDVKASHRGLEIGATIMAKAFQRTGHNRATKLALLTHAFETLDCVRVCFKTDARNTASRRAIARLGAIEEGTLRHHVIMPDGYHRDSVYFSLLAAEWPAVKERLTQEVAS